MSEVGVFSVIYNKIPDTGLLCHCSGIECGTVEFLVWTEALPVGIQTESLTHHPVGTGGMLQRLLRTRFVAHTHQSFAIAEAQGESILRFLLGVDVETFHIHRAHLESVSVGKAVEQYLRTYESVVFLVQGHSADGGYHIHHLAVAIHVEHPVVALFKHMLHYHSHHPYHSEHVVGMGMCNEEVMDIIDGDSSLGQLSQDTVSATGINHQPVAPRLHHETGVVAARHRGATRAEHDYSVFFFHILFPVCQPVAVVACNRNINISCCFHVSSFFHQHHKTS